MTLISILMFHVFVVLSIEIVSVSMFINSSLLFTHYQANRGNISILTRYF